MSNRLPLLALLLLPLGVACESSVTEPEPGPQPTRAFSVAANDSVLIDLADDTALVAASGSASWDLGFWRTTAFVNGGGQVQVACLCQNAVASDGQVMVMSPETELVEFEAVAAADVPPAGAAWGTDVFTTKPWYRYNLTGEDHQIWPTYEVYLVKRGSEVYKVQITGYYNEAGESRHITFRYVRLAD